MGSPRYDVYYWPTPNGHKVTILLEEAEVDYRLVPVDIRQGEQFTEAFVALSPNNRMPALVDHAPDDGGEPLAVFESGAILWYLAEQLGRFLPQGSRARADASQWLFWQMANQGPMSGQFRHFDAYATERIPYAIDRYRREVARLWAVLDRRLQDREYIAGDYSIADMACFPWVRPARAMGQDLAQFPHVQRWMEALKRRPAVERAYAKGKAIEAAAPPMTADSWRLLFGQDASTVSGRS